MSAGKEHAKSTRRWRVASRVYVVPGDRCPQGAQLVHNLLWTLPPAVGRRQGGRVTCLRWLRLLLIVGPCWLALAAFAPAAAAADWVLPLAGEPQVTRAFDPPATPYGPGHRGVDLAGTSGEQVRAAGSGTIGYAAPLAGRGVVTVLHDDGLRTTYEPVTAAVDVGQAVGAGQPIGTLEAGHAGCPVAACLHWGLLRGEVYLDPMSLLQPGPIRLLPRAGPAHPAGQPAAAWAPPAGSGSAPGTEEGPEGRAPPLAVTATLGVGLGAALVLRPPKPP